MYGLRVMFGLSEVPESTYSPMLAGLASVTGGDLAVVFSVQDPELKIILVEGNAAGIGIPGNKQPKYCPEP